MSVEQKITNDIKVPNNDLEVLKQHFSHCFDKNGNFDFEKFKNNLSENEINFSTESYSLDWLGKSYARLLASDPAATLLKADEKHNTKPENSHSENLLIKGDNLEVLKHLANAYHEKIKMIYIDPPYNTGSDGFVYADDRKFTVSELQQLTGLDEEKAKRILDFTQSKSNSHSAWLTFMYPRLYIARRLLKDDGVIFVSIDDNEVAQLRLLMDEVFGEENFTGELIWKSRQNKDNRNITGLSIDHEYVLCFSKSNGKRKLKGAVRRLEQYSNPDNDVRGDWGSGNMVGLLPQDQRPNCHYDLINPETGINYGKPKMGWRYDENTMVRLINEKRILWPIAKEGRPRRKVFLSEVSSELPNYTSIIGEKIFTRDGTKEVDELFANKYFDFPKPSALIFELINQVCENHDNELIFDFFAGSGTTGDAVMQLNAEDGGKRKYVLVQLPEPIDPKKKKTAYDFVKDDLKVAEPTIFEITKERLIRAAKKIKDETISSKIADKEKEIKEIEGELDLDNKTQNIKHLKAEIKTLREQDLGFKIFETTPIWEDYDFEADELDNQIELFDESKLSTDDLKALLTTWKTYDGIPLTQDLETVDLGGYIAYYGKKKLYLMGKGFTTDNLKTLLEKIDSDKKFEPNSIIAFGYHFDSKNLRELSENVKSYSNKKNTDIDFIIRY